MTLTTVAFFSQVEAALPEYRKGGIGKRAAADEALNLNVTVTREGVVVSGSGGKLARGCTTTAPGKVITVPAGMNGEHDWKGLTTCVSRVKKQFEDETRVTLSADPEVPYEDLIAAMDAVRGDDRRALPRRLTLGGDSIVANESSRPPRDSLAPPVSVTPASMSYVNRVVRAKLRRRAEPEHFGLNIYPMMDMLTILLVYMMAIFATLVGGSGSGKLASYASPTRPPRSSSATPCRCRSREAASSSTASRSSSSATASSTRASSKAAAAAS